MWMRIGKPLSAPRRWLLGKAAQHAATRIRFSTCCRISQIILCAAASQLAVAATAAAQGDTRNIPVLIESSLETAGRSFLAVLSQNLATPVRDKVNFVPIIVPAAGIQQALPSPSWTMAILSTATLKNAEIKTNAVAFEMPFIFSDIATIAALEQSPVGQAGLSTMSDHGITGLVYLNNGLTLLAERKELSTPSDLKTRTVAVFSETQADAFRKIGGVPVRVQSNDSLGVVQPNNVDSVPVNSQATVPWSSPNNEFQFLLTDSVRAQVGMIVTRDGSWNELPFPYRAAISDAAIAASEYNDMSLAISEQAFTDRARTSGVSLVSFKVEDATRATREWIGEQPQALRPIYSTVYDYVKSAAPQNAPKPSTSGQAGQVNKVYFATTRKDEGGDSVGIRFGDGRTAFVKCGRIQYPQDNPKASAATFDGKVAQDTQSCADFLKAVVRGSERTLLYIHGFNNRFSDALENAMALKNVLGAGTEVMLWSWPSKRDGFAGNYDYDKESVGGITVQLLVEVLRSLGDEAGKKPLDVLAHSMGAWHLLGAIETLATANSPPNFRNLVFAAPDIPTDEFGFGFSAMNRAAKRSTLYACAWDAALALSANINAHRRAGSGGSDIVVSSPMDSIDVDGTLSINHSYVFEAGKVRTDLTTLVKTAADPAARNLDEVPKPPWHYWRFN